MHNKINTGDWAERDDTKDGIRRSIRRGSRSHEQGRGQRTRRKMATVKEGKDGGNDEDRGND